MNAFKRYLLLGVVGLILLGACMERVEPDENSATVAGATAAVVAEASATETALLTETVAFEPTATIELPTSTPVPTATAVPTLPICNEPAAPPLQPDGALFLRYWSGSQVWVWSESDGVMQTFNIENSLSQPNSSPDGQYIAFTREAGAGAVELWIADSDGSNERLLATTSPIDLLERYPNAVRADFYFYWNGTEDNLLLTYYFYPVFDALGEPPPGPRTVIDINSGESWVLEIESTSAVSAISPSGEQTAVLLEDAVQLLDTQTGTVLFTVPVEVSPRFEQLFTYSQDSRTVIYLAENGFVLIDSETGVSREIPMGYAPVGLGHYSSLPGIYWSEDGRSFYTIVTENQQVFDRSATIALWYVDLETRLGELLHTFNGSFLSADLSPDRQLIVFWLQNVNDRQLFLADVESGQQIEYARGELIDFLGWNPDGRHFHYWLPGDRKPILGHPCETPRTFAELGFPELENNIRWVDADRFLYVDAVAEPGTDNTIWTIYLNKLNGESQVIGAGEGSYPQIEFYFEYNE